MKQYYDENIGGSFKTAIKEIKKQIGVEDYNIEKTTFGVAGNTFRAFRIENGYRPSVLFKEWAKQKTTQLIDQEDYDTINNQEDFDKWHSELFDEIKEKFICYQKKEISYAHTNKLVDLYIKWILSLKKCPEKLSKSITDFGYCALDSQILTKLNESLKYALPISEKISMGSIHNENTYQYCQSLIKDFAEHFSGKRIYFDFFAWKRGGAR